MCCEESGLVVESEASLPLADEQGAAIFHPDPYQHLEVWQQKGVFCGVYSLVHFALPATVLLKTNGCTYLRVELL